MPLAAVAGKELGRGLRPFIDTGDVDTGGQALHQKPHRPGSGVDGGKRRVVLRQYGAPNGVDRVIHPEQADRWMRDEAYAVVIALRELRESRQIDQLHRGMQRGSLPIRAEPHREGRQSEAAGKRARNSGNAPPYSSRYVLRGGRSCKDLRGPLEESAPTSRCTAG
jgi:hypothetical protein